VVLFNTEKIQSLLTLIGARLQNSCVMFCQGCFYVNLWLWFVLPTNLVNKAYPKFSVACFGAIYGLF
jgi:hypothetical protein